MPGLLSQQKLCPQKEISVQILTLRTWMNIWILVETADQENLIIHKGM